MQKYEDAVADFLAQECIAVAGVSRSGQDAANVIYKKLKRCVKKVYPVNPAAEIVEGEICYPSLEYLPEKVGAVVVSTPVNAVLDIAKSCAKLGIKRMWMHRSFGEGSVSEEAVAFCRENGITVIPGGCPMMFGQPVDFGHKCIHWIVKKTGGIPTHV